MSIFDYDHYTHLQASKEWPARHPFLWMPVGIVLIPISIVLIPVQLLTAASLSSWLPGPDGKDAIEAVISIPLLPVTPFIVRRSMKKCQKCKNDGLV